MMENNNKPKVVKDFKIDHVELDIQNRKLSAFGTVKYRRAYKDTLLYNQRRLAKKVRYLWRLIFQPLKIIFDKVIKKL